MTRSLRSVRHVFVRNKCLVGIEIKPVGISKFVPEAPPRPVKSLRSQNNDKTKLKITLYKFKGCIHNLHCVITIIWEYGLLIDNIFHILRILRSQKAVKTLLIFRSLSLEIRPWPSNGKPECFENVPLECFVEMARFMPNSAPSF